MSDGNQYEPYIDITDGQVTGTLQDGQPFYWYNPNNVAVTISACAPWANSDTYELPAGPSYTAAEILYEPCTDGLAWWDSAPWDGEGKWHVTSQNGESGPNTPNINIQTGVVTGTLQNGQNFYWYNPTDGDVDLEGCGTWCTQDQFTLEPGYTETTMLANPNEDAFSWTESPNQWDAPGMPHTQGPTRKREEKHKEVA